MSIKTAIFRVWPITDHLGCLPSRPLGALKHPVLILAAFANHFFQHTCTVYSQMTSFDEVGEIRRRKSWPYTKNQSMHILTAILVLLLTAVAIDVVCSR